MKTSKRLRELVAIVCLLCFAGCATENYVSVDPLLFVVEEEEPIEENRFDSYANTWDQYLYWSLFSDYLNKEMEEVWDVDSWYIPYGPFLIEYKKITEQVFTVSNVFSAY